MQCETSDVWLVKNNKMFFLSCSENNISSVGFEQKEDSQNPDREVSQIQGWNSSIN